MNLNTEDVAQRARRVSIAGTGVGGADADGVVTDRFLWLNGHPMIHFRPASTLDLSRRTATSAIHHAPTTGPTPFTLPQVLYVVTDHLGTPVMETTEAGAVTWQAEYEPYGNIHTMRAGTTTDQPLRLPGQEVAWHSPSGAEGNYNIHRWYRSGWGGVYAGRSERGQGRRARQLEPLRLWIRKSGEIYRSDGGDGAGLQRHQ